MPLKILPKKRWHVWTRENIERVERDEAKHAEEQRLARKRMQEREQEARIELLKRRRSGEPPPAAPALLSSPTAGAGADSAQLGDAEPPRQKKRRRRKGRDEARAVVPAPSADTSVAAGHINFFADLERQLEADGTARNPAKDAQNPEYQAEKKKEEEAHARRLGIQSWGLGQSAAETQGDNKPWYHFEPGQAPLRDRRGRALKDGAATYARHKDDRRKGSSDPFAVVKRVLDAKAGRGPPGQVVLAGRRDPAHRAATGRAAGVRPVPGWAATSARPTGSSGSLPPARDTNKHSERGRQSASGRRRSGAGGHTRSRSRSRSPSAARSLPRRGKHKHSDHNDDKHSRRRHRGAKDKKRSKSPKKRSKRDKKKTSKRRSKSSSTRRRRRSSSSSSADSSPSGAATSSHGGRSKPHKPPASSTPSIAELRRQRLERERRESRRQGQLFVVQADAAEAPSTEEGARAYSSQFNPHLARRR